MKKITIIFLLTVAFAQSSFSQIINFGHTQHSGRNTASFGILRTDYDNFTDFFYWNDAAIEKDLSPVVYGGVDENYWNAGANAKYGTLKASLLFYEQIANYKNWPSNMTDLGVVVNFGIGENFTMQARYYDFCYSGGKGTAMPGGTLACLLGKGEYKHRLAASLDWSFWYLEPWYADTMFAKPFVNYDFSKDGSNGFGLQYRGSFPFAGAGNETDISDVAKSHTISFWAGIAKDIENFTVGVRPNAYITFNAVNLTDLPKNKKGEIEDYNPFARDGNKEFHILLPATITYHVTDKIEIIAAVFFGLYYANFDHISFTDQNGNVEKYKGTGGSNKKGWVNEKGVGLGLNFTISPRCSFQIGSNFIRIPELTGTGSNNAFENHRYTAENLSAANIAKAPLSISGKFSF